MTESTSALRDAELLTAGELAALLRVSKSSVYRLVEARLIPFHRMRKGLRFARQDVEAYVRSCKVESAATLYERTKAG